MFFVMKVELLTLFIYLIFNNVLDFLLISNDFTNHYEHIKDFNRLVFNKTKNKNKK